MFPALFANNEYLIDEKVQFLTFANNYKLYDNQGTQIGQIKQKLTTGKKILQLFLSKAMLPFTLEIQDIDEKCVAQVSRGWTFWMSKIKITDSEGIVIGYIKQKFAFLKPTFKIFNANQEEIGQIAGDWKAWNFTIKNATGESIGTINKKWAGAVKEIFTTADKYYVSIDPSYNEDLNKVIILSTAITIDMVLKESK